MTVSSTARLRRVLPVLACMTLLLLVSCCSPFSKGLGTDSDDFLDDQEDVEGSAAEAPLPPSATIWDTIESADADAVAELVEAVHEKDDDDARVKLAALHLFGSSTTTKLARDVEEALALAQYAADKGHPAAQFLVGFMHATGMGVDADQGKALLYYTFAALHDDPFAQVHLTEAAM
ncbi:hypothetical protein PTSG_08313 [Salpingoeca rosetta]|uniref:Sel1 repeat family protein n=1 Tax=Salpingoeca rosetta (strain ATCC 50818 / BSB-021) TaxID=946362 RepID=F2UJC2_SALR5|nr:uncharacterized protein PTSG_08313 [Salpingoeca rosetta]EGD77221.1 hypothetical protein PTSG_08313 [Salpingoeca rosetta]|eukprot:XP_004990565.1 hypothetical protein PTSG_08313 [Salpingoeca rosetta]